MSDWIHSLPVTWMALLVFGFTYFVVAVIYAVVRLSAVGERARAFKSVSPGMLPPLGIVFGRAPLRRETRRSSHSSSSQMSRNDRCCSSSLE